LSDVLRAWTKMRVVSGFVGSSHIVELIAVCISISLLDMRV
jgi:hypothetical protein